ncbi:MAG: response regulator [Undibacterium sp.]|nr:response regulator [Opitutaceae bacterium]
MSPIQTQQPSVAQKPLRILYAEDMRELRQVAQMSLTRQGHSIECCVDGAAALERLAADPDAFDVLITDHHMPNLNGLELVGALRRSQPFTGKIVVFCSELSPQISAAYAALRVDAFLKKPVFPSALREVLLRLQASEPASA